MGIIGAFPAAFQRTEIILGHILDGVVAGMVQYDIHHDTDAVLVRRIDERAELLGSAKICVRVRVIHCIIAVIGVMREARVSVSAHDIAVNLLIRGAQPNGINAQVCKIALFNLFRNAGEIAAVERSARVNTLHGVAVLVKSSSIGVVVFRVAVVKTVCEQKVNRCVVPRKCGSSFCRLSGLLHRRVCRNGHSCTQHTAKHECQHESDGDCLFAESCLTVHSFVHPFICFYHYPRVLASYTVPTKL